MGKCEADGRQKVFAQNIPFAVSHGRLLLSGLSMAIRFGFATGIGVTRSHDGALGIGVSPT